MCSVDHCDKPVVARGFCRSHYYASRKYGNPLGLKQKQHHGKTLKERFDIYTRKSDGCWEWVGHRDPNGYGRLNVGGTPMLASRIAYLVHYGDIPTGMCVCHKCDCPSCVNPEHIFIGTQADNVSDMHAKGRARKRGLKGEDHHQARITADIVRKIRASKKSGPELAEEFGISRTTVSEIRKRKTWAHIK